MSGATVWGERIGPRDFRVYARFEDAIDRFRPGDRLRIRIDRDRNGKFNAFYHLMLSKICAAANRGPVHLDIDGLKKWVKLKRGWFEVVPLPPNMAKLAGQETAIEYISTSFAAMPDESEFHRFAADTRDLIRDELAPYIAGSPEWEEISAMLDSIRRPEEVCG